MTRNWENSETPEHELERLRQEVHGLRQRAALADALEARAAAARRLRREVWRMERPGHIGRVTRCLKECLNDLGVEHDAFGINLIEESPRPSLRFRTHTWVEGKQYHGDLQAQPNPVLEALWRTGTPQYREDLDSSDPYGEGKRFGELRIRSVVDIPFSRGTVAISSSRPHAFSLQDIAAVQELTEALADGFRRVEDIRRLEEQHQRQHRLRDAALAIREAVWRMQDPEGIHGVLEAVGAALDLLELPHLEYGVNLVDTSAEPPRFRFNTRTRQGWEVGRENTAVTAALLAAWRSGQPYYRPDLTVADPDGIRERLAERAGTPVRSVLDVPFSHGTLAVNSERPHAFTEGDILCLKELGAALGDGFARLADLQQLQERHRALEASEARYRALVDSAPVAIVVYRDERIVMANPQAAAMLAAASPADLVGLPLADLVHPEGHAAAEEIRARRRAGYPGPLAFEGRIRRLDGRSLDVELMGAGVEYEGAPAVQVVLRDVTGRRWRERSREAVQRVHVQVLRMDRPEDVERVLMAVRDGLLALDVPFQVCGLNVVDRTCTPPLLRSHTLGRDDQTVETQAGEDAWVPISTFLQRSEPTYRPDLAADDLYGERLRLERAYGFPVRAAVDVPFADGTLAVNSARPHAFSARDLGLLAEMAGLLSTAFTRARDLQSLVQRNRELEAQIAARLQMERELVRVERLRAVGELAAGISHNLNNLLTGILGPAQLLGRMTTDPELLREVHDITTSGLRARDLVQRLQRSVRRMADERLEPVDLPLVMQDALVATRPRWQDASEAQGIAIGMVTEVEEVPPVRATRAGVQDLLTNLLFNAVDAMPRGGTITVRAEAAGGRVRLSVRDTGIGMDEETRRRLFEPFFTTKMDVGTGLGLSTVYASVQSWGGQMEVTSEPGRGTCFTVLLLPWEPAADPRPGSGTGSSPR
ncbi:MAG: ATP-binding protein [Candidatus Latescibacterota bacterium]